MVLGGSFQPSPPPTAATAWADDICQFCNGRTAFDLGGDVKADMEPPDEGRPLSGVVDGGRVGVAIVLLCDEAGTKKDIDLVGDGG